jgi:hypothetical protein
LSCSPQGNDWKTSGMILSSMEVGCLSFALASLHTGVFRA